MKFTLRILALIIFVAALGLWAAMGANRGWTKTRVPEKIDDSVTGIEGVTYVRTFVPGVDFLAAAAAVSLALAGMSLLFRTKTGETHQTNKPANQ